MAIRYIPFPPNTVAGQAVLDNFQRTQRVQHILYYQGRERIEQFLQRGLPLYETRTVEQVGDNAGGNIVMRGECVAACAYLREHGIKADLVYIDPPFASGADYAKKVYLRRNPKAADKTAMAVTEVEGAADTSFEEKMYGDIWQKEDYLNWMYENLVAIKSVMSDNATIYVHLDWHIGHYVKILMDEIFGEDNFQNEIIWHYYNKMQGNVNRFASNHDTILVYHVSNNYYYTPIKEERETATKQIKRTWNKDKQKLVNAKDENGKVIYIESTEKTIDDVWRLSMLQPADKEEPVGYATQKPEALLERVIKASSNEGMLVADFFGGSGVTAAVASRLGRRFVHCDINISSIETTRDRLVKGKAQFSVMEVEDGVRLFRNPVQTMDRLTKLIPGFKRDTEGLDKRFWSGTMTDSRHGMMPVYVPDLQGSREPLDIPTINHILSEALPDLPGDVTQVIVYYIDITDYGEIRDFIKDNNNTLIGVELRDMKPLLDNVVIDDEAHWHVEETKEGLIGGWRVTIDDFFSDRVDMKIKDFNLRGQAQAATGKKRRFTPITLSPQGLEMIEMVSLDCHNAPADAPWHSDEEILVSPEGRVRRNGIATTGLWDGTITSQLKPLRMKIRNVCGDETVFTL